MSCKYGCYLSSEHVVHPTPIYLEIDMQSSSEAISVYRHDLTQCMMGAKYGSLTCQIGALSANIVRRLVQNLHNQYLPISSLKHAGKIDFAKAQDVPPQAPSKCFG